MKAQYKISSVILSLFLFFSFSCNDETPPKIDYQEEKENLIKSIEEFNSAFVDGNVEILESLITDNYLHTNSSSRVIRKDDWLEYLKKRKNELEGGELIITNYLMDETEVEFYNNMAIVTGKISYSTVNQKERKENEIRITNIWIKEAGLWKRAGFHDSRIR